MTYPETYLHVENSKTGETWISPISPRKLLCLETRVKEWIKTEFGGELRLDGKIAPLMDGDYYAKIKIDGEPPESVRSWKSGGFFLKSTY